MHLIGMKERTVNRTKPETSCSGFRQLSFKSSVLMFTMNSSAGSRPCLLPRGLVLRGPMCRHSCLLGKISMRSAIKHARNSRPFNICVLETWLRTSSANWNGASLSFRHGNLAELAPPPACVDARQMVTLQMDSVLTVILRLPAVGALSLEVLQAAWEGAIPPAVLQAVQWVGTLPAKGPWVGRRR
jgi:hypothetical protein